jgi:hypothetical protein
MTSLDLIAGSRAEEAGYLALADISRLAEQTGIDYRIVGGQMVGLHVAASGAEDPALRQGRRRLTGRVRTPLRAAWQPFARPKLLA